jgi:hypothetical protein
MNLQARIDRYKERGFQQVEAEILVLIEESAAALFTAFPEQFILFGGASLDTGKHSIGSMNSAMRFSREPT